MWQCDRCQRRFGRVNQGHECQPAVSLDEYFSTGPEFERPIFEAILDILQRCDPDVWFEPLAVGVFFKRRTTFVQLRTMTKWVAVCFNLERTLASQRVSRKIIAHGSRYYHVVNIRTAEAVDHELAGWLTEAWETDV